MRARNIRHVDATKSSTIVLTLRPVVMKIHGGTLTNETTVLHDYFWYKNKTYLPADY